MAYYPAQDIKIVSAKTEPEMEAAVAAAMADGYFPVNDNEVWNGKLVAPTIAYRQAMVKRENTDPQFIAAMYAAFKPALDDIRAHLASIDTKLSTTNNCLSYIDSKLINIDSKLNTANSHLASIDSKLNTANSHLASIETNTNRISTLSSDAQAISTPAATAPIEETK